jgi:hypothetical protein
MSWEHAAEARAALNAIVSDPEHGVAALSSAQTMSNLLKDLLPDAPREKSILVAAAEAGLADTLRQHVDQGMDPDTAIRLTSSSFSSTTPFTPDACSWVTGEIATALGMSHSQPAGQGGPGGAVGGPAGFGAAGPQGLPTQVAQSPGGFAGGEQQQTQGQGGFGSAAAQETRPGAWQQPGQQQGGYGQQQGYGQQGYGQPGAPGAGYAQPGAPGGWQSPGQPAGQPGYVQPGGPGGWQGPGQPGGGGGFGPGPGGTSQGKSRRGWFIGGGVALVAVIAVVIGVSLAGGGGKNKPTPPPNTSPIVNPTTSSPSSPTATPTATHPPGTAPLTTIMNPVGAAAVGTGCVAAKTFNLNASTLDASTFCPHTTRSNVVVWGYQFDNSADYVKGLADINHYVGFDKLTPGSGCPPPSGDAEGSIGWHANHNSNYKSRTGQDIECLTDDSKPLLIWTMPTQDTFLIGQNNTKGSSLSNLIKWWETLDYGP